MVKTRTLANYVKLLSSLSRLSLATVLNWVILADICTSIYIALSSVISPIICNPRSNIKPLFSLCNDNPCMGVNPLLSL